MNREIKFRAWTGNRMIDFKEVCDMHATPWNSTSLKWMQFTGLHDKNGVEIYESDRVLFDDEERVVVWNHMGWELQQKDTAAHAWDLWNPERCEVIGNIYESPELL